MEPDRPLSAEEKRQQLKEQYKRELLEHRQKMKQLANARRIQGVERTLSELEAGPLSNADDVLDQIQHRTAHAEARLDLALEKPTQATDLPPDLTRTLGDAELALPRPTDDVVQAPTPTKTLGDDVV